MIRVTYTTQIDCYNDKVTVDSPGTVDELELKANKVVKLGEKDTNYRSLRKVNCIQKLYLV